MKTNDERESIFTLASERECRRLKALLAKGEEKTTLEFLFSDCKRRRTEARRYMCQKEASPDGLASGVEPRELPSSCRGWELCFVVALSINKS